jgi:hypothetical protein
VTGLIDAGPLWDLPRVNVLVRSLLSHVAAVLSLVCLVDLGFPGLDQSDR